MSEKLSISVSNKAVEMIKFNLNKRGTLNSYIRLGVKGGACSGYIYVIEFYDDEPKKHDNVFIFDDVKILVDSKSLIILNGVELDWEQKVFSSGFKFNNPNVKSICGCGSSFSL